MAAWAPAPAAALSRLALLNGATAAMSAGVGAYSGLFWALSAALWALLLAAAVSAWSAAAGAPQQAWWVRAVRCGVLVLGQAIFVSAATAFAAPWACAYGRGALLWLAPPQPCWDGRNLALAALGLVNFALLAGVGAVALMLQADAEVLTRNPQALATLAAPLLGLLARVVLVVAHTSLFSLPFWLALVTAAVRWRAASRGGEPRPRAARARPTRSSHPRPSLQALFLWLLQFLQDLPMYSYTSNALRAGALGALSAVALWQLACTALGALLPAAAAYGFVAAAAAGAAAGHGLACRALDALDLTSPAVMRKFDGDGGSGLAEAASAAAVGVAGASTASLALGSGGGGGGGGGGKDYLMLLEFVEETHPEVTCRALRELGPSAELVARADGVWAAARAQFGGDHAGTALGFAAHLCAHDADGTKVTHVLERVRTRMKPTFLQRYAAFLLDLASQRSRSGRAGAGAGDGSMDLQTYVEFTATMAAVEFTHRRVLIEVRRFWRIVDAEEPGGHLLAALALAHGSDAGAGDGVGDGDGDAARRARRANGGSRSARVAPLGLPAAGCAADAGGGGGSMRPEQRAVGVMRAVTAVGMSAARARSASAHRLVPPCADAGTVRARSAARRHTAVEDAPPDRKSVV